MSELHIHTSATAEWLSLVNEAESAAALHLDEEIQSYLVFLLMRFTERPELAASVLAVEYLQSMQSQGRIGHDQLRNVGDKCLLYSGLFPERAERRRVKISYFVDLGRSAYQQLSDRMEHSAAAMYHHLADAFVSLMDILQTMRSLGNPAKQLGPFHAFELWRDTGSRVALTTLRKSTQATPLVIPSPDEENRH
jgi:hypothetical protein